MRVCIMCPGQFSFGLDSPERGESRWSQNYAKMLAKAGHDVYAASMGSNYPDTHYGAKLIHETECNKYGPFDIFIDSAWWKDKRPKAEAKVYICLKWSLEEYTREFNFPDNFYLAYPYPSHRFEFTDKNFKGMNRTFPLPTMFGEKFPEPNWNKDRIFLPGKIDKNRNYKPYMESVLKFLNKYKIEGGSNSFFRKEFEGRLNPVPGSNLYESNPYNIVMESMGKSKLSLPILNPGCIIEAAFMGTPSIFWEEGGFYNILGNMLDVMIKHGDPPEKFEYMVEEMMNNRKLHSEVTRGTQDYFSCHLYDRALNYFNDMVETIL